MFVYFQSCIEFIMTQPAHIMRIPFYFPIFLSSFPTLLFPYFNITQMDMSYVFVSVWSSSSSRTERNIMIRWMIVLCTSSHELNSYKWHASILIPHPHVCVSLIFMLLYAPSCSSSVFLFFFSVSIMCIWIICVYDMWGKMANGNGNVCMYQCS